MQKLHYSTSPDAKPTCERCGALIDPGRTTEPYTRTLSIWLQPPYGFFPCYVEMIDANNPARKDDSTTSPSADVDEPQRPKQPS